MRSKLKNQPMAGATHSMKVGDCTAITISVKMFAERTTNIRGAINEHSS
jgi:hypothetical protein